MKFFLLGGNGSLLGRIHPHQRAPFAAPLSPAIQHRLHVGFELLRRPARQQRRRRRRRRHPSRVVHFDDPIGDVRSTAAPIGGHASPTRWLVRLEVTAVPFALQSYSRARHKDMPRWHCTAGYDELWSNRRLTAAIDAASRRSAL